VSTIQVKPNAVQQTILDQLKALEPLYRFLYKVQNIVLGSEGSELNENSLRIACRTRKHINFDVRYEPNPDLYTVKAYLLANHGLNCDEILSVSEVCWEELGRLLAEAHQKAEHFKPKPQQNASNLPNFDEIPDVVRMIKEKVERQRLEKLGKT
jgi:hypothetical protein